MAWDSTELNVLTLLSSPIRLRQEVDRVASVSLSVKWWVVGQGAEPWCFWIAYSWFQALRPRTRRLPSVPLWQP